MAVSYILKLILPVKTKKKILKKIAYPPNPLSTLHPLYNKVHLWERHVPCGTKQCS